MKRFIPLVLAALAVIVPARAHAYATTAPVSLALGESSHKFDIGSATDFYCVVAGFQGPLNGLGDGFTLYPFDNGTNLEWYLQINTATPNVGTQVTVQVSCGLWSDFHGHVPEVNLQPLYGGGLVRSGPPVGGTLWNVSDSFCSIRGFTGGFPQSGEFVVVAPSRPTWFWEVAPSTQSIDLFTGCFSFSGVNNPASVLLTNTITLTHGQSGGNFTYSSIALPDPKQWLCALTEVRGSMAQVTYVVDETSGQLTMTAGAGDTNDLVGATCVKFLVQ